jgi:3-hydroxyacyl-CoA dehydrogenase/3a,7a,12a-trihydroxy-5b-cholest-24-enoyl-CoA hydratase
MLTKGIYCNAIAPVAGSRMTATVWPEKLLQLLKPEQVTPLVVYLAHHSTSVNGEAFEVGGGWIGQVKLARSDGAFIEPSQMTAEAVGARWNDIADLSRITFPDTAPIDTVMGHLSAKL